MKKKAQKRKIDILILSDIHLGSYGCYANRLIHYLSGIDTDMLILNGDIVDLWLFDKKKWPVSHSLVLNCFIDYIKRGIPVYLITGNHDDYLRNFSGFTFHNFHIHDEIILNLNGQKTWIFHGDKFDKSVSGSKRKWAIRAGKAFDSMIKWNRELNAWEAFLGWRKSQITKYIKNKTKSSVKASNDFEQHSINYAAKQGMDAVVCGHVHAPGIWKMCSTENKKEIIYMNSGDWMDHCTSLEYSNGQWSLYRYQDEEHAQARVLKEVTIEINKDILADLNDRPL